MVATFLASDDSHFDVISCALSCILVAVRLLSVPELIDATTISLEAQDKAALTRGMQTHDFLYWLRQREHPFHIDENLRITFEDKNMPHFLRKVPVRGVDNTHRTLAMICLRRMQKCENSDARRNPSDDTSPLMDYAACFWKHHCELAARNDNPDRLHHLKNDVRRRCCESVQSENLNGTYDQRNFTGTDQRPSAALHTDSDWVFVKARKVICIEMDLLWWCNSADTNMSTGIYIIRGCFQLDFICSDP